MLNYKNFIQKIYEGLIITHDLDKSVNVLSNLLDDFSIFYSIEKSDEYRAFKIKIENPSKLTIFHYEKLFNTINNLGYFQSAYKLSKSGMTKSYKWSIFDDFIRNINKKIELLELIIESKKDKELNNLPKKLYHLTTDKNINKILKIGLIPKNKNKRSFHLDRIYLTDKLENIYKLLDKFIFDNKINNKSEKYIILEIDTTNLDIKLYLDPKFKDGVYTEENIGPEYIKISETDVMKLGTPQVKNKYFLN
jgi:hypothetical protein